MSDRNVPAHEALSALADGEATSSEVAQACAAWRQDPASRARWNEYHLIGDVMRAPDAAEATPSAAFLSKFKERLAQEPVVLAPAATRRATGEAAAADAVAPHRALRPLQRRAWTGPFAVAASFVAVVAALLGNQVGPALDSGTLLGVMAPADDGLRNSLIAPHTVSVAESPSFDRPASGPTGVLRDPRVDQALTSVPGVPAAANLSFTNAGALTRQVSDGSASR